MVQAQALNRRCIVVGARLAAVCTPIVIRWQDRAVALSVDFGPRPPLQAERVLFYNFLVFTFFGNFFI
jgi:hypothetical protein